MLTAPQQGTKHGDDDQMDDAWSTVVRPVANVMALTSSVSASKNLILDV